jgi:hypothetical protein
MENSSNAIQVDIESIKKARISSEKEFEVEIVKICNVLKDNRTDIFYI